MNTVLTQNTISNNTQDQIREISLKCIEVFEQQFNLGKAFISNTGSIQFIDCEAFRAYYFLSNNVRNVNYERYVAMHTYIRNNFLGKEQSNETI